jgi:catechol O-methyltransferase
LQFDNRREEELAEFVTSKRDLRNSRKAILAAIDKFARTRKYLMNVGEDKGAIVAGMITRRKPEIMVELGGYCVSSTILFANELWASGGKKYFSLERNPKCAKNILTLVEFGGLGDVVEVIAGPSNESMKKLHDSSRVEKIDIFLDHYKPSYTTNLKFCESLGMIQKDTVWAADNVVTRDAEKPSLFKTRPEHSTGETYGGNKPADKSWHRIFPSRSAAQYGKIEVLSAEAKGDPDKSVDGKL